MTDTELNQAYKTELIHMRENCPNVFYKINDISCPNVFMLPARFINDDCDRQCSKCWEDAFNV